MTDHEQLNGLRLRPVGRPRTPKELTRLMRAMHGGGERPMVCIWSKVGVVDPSGRRRAPESDTVATKMSGGPKYQVMSQRQRNLKNHKMGCTERKGTNPK